MCSILGDGGAGTVYNLALENFTMEAALNYDGMNIEVNIQMFQIMKMIVQLPCCPFSRAITSGISVVHRPSWLCCKEILWMMECGVASVCRLRHCKTRRTYFTLKVQNTEYRIHGAGSHSAVYIRRSAYSTLQLSLICLTV